MAIIGLILIGSRARGDHSEDSDTDLLAVARGGKPAMLNRGNVTISRYPFGHVIDRARAGDLFVYHVVSEGISLYGDEPVFEKIIGAFSLRGDYSREVKLASDVGWFLVHYPARFDDKRRFNKRMAWCAHTMIVARAAMQRVPVFSADGLAEFAGSSDVAAVIKNKAEPSVSHAVFERFRGVLTRFGTAEPPPLPGLDDERRRFEADGNVAGMGAVRLASRAMPARMSETDSREVPHEHAG